MNERRNNRNNPITVKINNTLFGLWKEGAKGNYPIKVKKEMKIENNFFFLIYERRNKGNDPIKSGNRIQKDALSKNLWSEETFTKTQERE